jgi:hypothetical protein
MHDYAEAFSSQMHATSLAKSSEYIFMLQWPQRLCWADRAGRSKLALQERLLMSLHGARHCALNDQVLNHASRQYRSELLGRRLAGRGLEVIMPPVAYRRQAVCWHAITCALPVKIVIHFFC